MSIIDRIILTLCTIALAAISVIVICFVAGFIHLDVITRFWIMAINRWEVAAVAGVFLLFSLKLLYTGTSSSKPKDLVIQVADEGIVRVSAVAVKNFIEKSAAQVPGVDYVKADVYSKGSALKVKLATGILPETQIPEVSQLLKDKVKASVKETVGREVDDVQIIFNTIDSKNAMNTTKV